MKRAQLILSMNVCFLDWIFQIFLNFRILPFFRFRAKMFKEAVIQPDVCGSQKLSRRIFNSVKMCQYLGAAICMFVGSVPFIGIERFSHTVFHYTLDAKKLNFLHILTLELKKKLIRTLDWIFFYRLPVHWMKRSLKSSFLNFSAGNADRNCPQTPLNFLRHLRISGYVILIVFFLRINTNEREKTILFLWTETKDKIFHGTIVRI